MSKVILTKEQAEAIEKVIAHKSRDYILTQIIQGVDVVKEYQFLHALSIDELANVLYVPNSYAIEQPKFEVGDWVIHIRFGFKGCKRLTFIDEKYAIVEGDNTKYLLENIDHATKEEIFWAELGREVGEFIDGDVVVMGGWVSSYKLRSKQDLLDAKKDYRNKHLKGFYPAEAFKPFPTGN